MKKVVLIAALASVFASQAFAQSYDPDEGSGNIVNPPAAQATNGQFGVGTGAYASAPYDETPSTSVPKRLRHSQRMQMN